MLRNSEKTHKLLPVKILFLDSAACFVLAKAPETSAGFFFDYAVTMRKPVSIFSSLSLCFTSHKKEYLLYPLLFERFCSCDNFKAFFLLFIWYPIYSLILVNFIVANWDVSFWFTFVFCQKKKWYVHLHVDIHTSEKLFLFFILNLWGWMWKMSSILFCCIIL